MIEVQNLTKYYGERPAIQNLSFEIRSGEAVGFLGLNGAGKTTTLRILGCVLLPSSGQVRVDGLDVTAHPHEVRRKIGFLPDVAPLYGEMTVGSYLTFAARLRGVPGKEAKARVQESEEKLGLREVHDDLISSLSYGYRQRVGLAQALVHRPRLLILDEPSAGLDPVQIVEMRNLLRRLRGEHTVLISSHFLSEISQTCDRLLVIQSGRIVAQGSEEELAASLGTPGDIEVNLRAPAPKVADVVRSLPSVVDVQVDETADHEIVLRIRATQDIRSDIARTLVQAGYELVRLDRSASRLESIFIELAHRKSEGMS